MLFRQSILPPPGPSLGGDPAPPCLPGVRSLTQEPSAHRTSFPLPAIERNQVCQDLVKAQSQRTQRSPLCLCCSGRQRGLNKQDVRAAQSAAPARQADGRAAEAMAPRWALACALHDAQEKQGAGQEQAQRFSRRPQVALDRQSCPSRVREFQNPRPRRA